MPKSGVKSTLVEVQWCIKRVWERRLSEFGSNVSRMTCLDAQDGCSSGEVVFVHDGCGSPSVAKMANQRMNVLIRLLATHAETPTPSKTLDRATKDLGSVTPKVYCNSTVGVILAASRAPERNLTCVCSSE